MISAKGGVTIACKTFDNSSSEIHNLIQLSANLVENRTGCIYAAHKLVLDVREFRCLENVHMEGTQEVEIVGMDTPVNLALFDGLPKLKRLTLRRVSGLAPSDDNFEALQALKRRDVEVAIIDNEAFDQGYMRFTSKMVNVSSSANMPENLVSVAHLGQHVVAVPDGGVTRNTLAGDRAEPTDVPFQTFSANSSKRRHG